MAAQRTVLIGIIFIGISESILCERTSDGGDTTTYYIFLFVSFVFFFVLLVIWNVLSLGWLVCT